MAPRFSIIIPTRNRAKSLEHCLKAIEKLDYEPSRVEVLVVDDGSSPRILDTLGQRKSLQSLSILRTEGVGPATARNLALRHANGDIVVFTDDDCRPRPDWLREFENAARERSGTGFGGRIVNASTNGIYGTASQMIVSFLYEYADLAVDQRFYCSNNLALPRQALIELGGFDESFPLAAAEDRDLCARWLKQGHLEYVPLAIVEHHQNLKLSSFLIQHYRYGVGAFEFWLRRRAEGAPEKKLEPWPFYVHMVAYPFHKTDYFRALIICTLIAISQVALGCGYYSEIFRKRILVQ